MIVFLAWAFLVCILFLSQGNAFSVRAFSLGRQTLPGTLPRGGAKPTSNIGPFGRKSANPDQVDAFENQNDKGGSMTAFQRLRWPIFIAVVVSIAYALLPGENLLSQYKQLLSDYPLRTKVATGAILALVGDALAQSRNVSEKYDSYRAASFAAFDSCYRVFQHVAFPLLVGKCRGRLLGGILSSVKGSTKDMSDKLVHYLAATEQTMAYQLCVVPLLYYPVFFTFTGFMQGLTLKQTLERAKADFIPCWKRNMIFWIPMQFFMFGFLDTKWQIPFSCVMGIVWSTILSAFAGRATVVTCVGDECDIETER
jgi:hypothetical protein